MRRPRGENGGFTLLELLVVIAIITALAAILYPVFMQAKDTSRMRVCASNLRQLGTAIRQYADDYDGYAVPQCPPSYPDPWVIYVEPIRRYTRQSATRLYPTGFEPSERPIRLWICPGDVRRGGSSPKWAYAGASYLYPGPGGFAGAPLTTESEIFFDDRQTHHRVRKFDAWEKPRRDLLLSDRSHANHCLAGSGDKQGWPTDDTTRLTKSMNVLMLDLHMTAVSADMVLLANGRPGTYLLNTLRYDNPYNPDKSITWPGKS